MPDAHVLLRRLRAWEGQGVRAAATAPGLRGPTAAAPSLCACAGRSQLAGGGKQAGGAALLELRFLAAALVPGAALCPRTETRKPHRERGGPEPQISNAVCPGLGSGPPVLEILRPVVLGTSGDLHFGNFAVRD